MSRQLRQAASKGDLAKVIAQSCKRCLKPAPKSTLQTPTAAQHYKWRKRQARTSSLFWVLKKKGDSLLDSKKHASAANG